jgi:AcrR family transcriptional regulator
MPTPTFEKLSTEKKEIILQNASKLFAFNQYHQASLDILAKQIGIAKGSLYQYFENKKDLYFYLISYIQKEKQNYIGNQLKEIPSDFFEMLYKISKITYQYEKENPIYRQVLFNAQYEKYEKELGDLHAQNWQQSVSYFKNILLSPKYHTQIKKDISIENIAKMLTQMLRSISEIPIVFSEKETDNYILLWIDLLKKGLKAII